MEAPRFVTLHLQKNGKQTQEILANHYLHPGPRLQECIEIFTEKYLSERDRIKWISYHWIVCNGVLKINAISLMKPWKIVYDTWKAKTKDEKMNLSVSKFWENKAKKKPSTNEAWQLAISNSLQYINVLCIQNKYFKMKTKAICM